MDPLEQVRVFLDCFKVNVNPTDPLPVRVPVYNLKYDEIKPAIVDWTRTYLDQFGCPPCILTPIIRKVSEAVLSHCKENPQSCGYTGRDYKTLQLNHEVISRVNQTCSELLDNENLNKLLAELPRECQAMDQTDSVVATRKKTHFSRGVKHKRRTMEDRHVCLPDFNTLFETKDTEPTAFYGVYDGHGGQEAASFAASHLHYNIAQSAHYPHQMELAFWEGFLKTDKQFLEKCENHHLRSGSTVVVCFHRLISKKIHIAWVGDSQAMLVAGSKSGCTYDTLVHPTHAASNPQECERIRRAGGSVLIWDGQYRVNGQLAITRAIGNPNHKDVVTAQPDTTWRRYKEDDAFLVLASDGLWENCQSYSISMFILYAIRKFPDNPQKITDYLIEFAKPHTTDNITVIIVFLKDLQTIIKDTPFIEEIEFKARIQNSRNMDINGADNNDIMAKNSSIPLEDQKAFVDIQNFMAIDSALLKPKSASPLCVGPVDDMGFLSDGGLGPETDVDGLHDTKQQTHPLFPEEEDESPVLDNGDAGHGFVSNLEQNTIGDYNPFGLTSDVMVEALGNVPEDISNEIEEEEPSSVSAEPVDLSEEHAAPETPHLNGSGEHHFDEPTEAGQLIDAVEEEDAVPAMKAELNENELAPLKSGDEPIVNDLLGGDSIVDNKLIDQLDSFGISDAIRRQLIEQQVTGATMNHEQEEDEDDGQLMEEKHSEFEAGDDGAEKGDLHHEKAFDSDNVNVSDHHSADVKQDDDAGCCEDSEEDEWDYVKVNQQQQEQQQEQHNQLEHPQTEEKPQESTLPEETVESQFGNSNSFVTADQEEEKEELVDRHSEEQTHELEQHRDQEVEQEKEQQQQQQQPQQQQEEKPEELCQEQEREAEVQLDATVEPNTSAAPVDILGDNTESTVSESTKQVDDVIIVAGGEAKEVVNLLNDFNEDVPQPETLCETNINEEDSSAVHLIASEGTNMEASMYGGSVAEQPASPDTPVSPVESFEQQQQQQQHQQQQLYSEEKDMFGSSLDETMSPTGAEELHEKHLYEAEEKTMHQGGAGDLGWQLNPEAKEFVPVVSPTEELTNVFAPGRMLEHESFKLREDAIVAQSPRKGTAPSMEDLDLPAERDFQTEMDKRPHEFEAALEEGVEQQSPLSPNPFDQLDDRVMPGNGLDLMNGGALLQPEEGDLLAPGKVDPVQFGTSETASAEELELLNKVQELPVGEDEEQQEPLIAQQHYEPIRAVSLPGQEELGVDVMEPQTYSAKEELYVEQKETVDEPAMDAASPVSAEVVQDFSQLSMNGHTEKENATNPFAQDNTYFETSVPSDAPQAESDLFGASHTHVDTIQATTESPVTMETEEEPKPRFYQESLLEASVYDPEPSLLSTQEPSAPAEPEPSVEIASEPAATAASAVSDVAVEPPKEPLAVEVAPPVEEQPKEAVTLAEENKTAVEAAASGVAAATAVVAAAAVAATAVAASKTAKAKVPASTGAKKAGPTITGTKSSSAASKDGAAKSTTATASRVASGAGAPAAASRKPTVPAVKKAPTTTAKPPAAASTNGVKEARPASSTAAAKPSLAVKKPATDAAKTATTTKTTAAPSVPAARSTKAATVPSSTTKTASASSTTRTAAPKPATTGTTTAAKATSRLSTTGTTTRTVTSRPSSAISTSSVPSKPASATTTTTVKRTVAAKTTNGTTTTDGVAKTTKTSTSTTTSSTASRTGVTRPAGTGTAAAKPSSTLAAKKPLDTKSAAAGTKTATAKPSTTTRTSLAPKTTATSPAVRKVQQNGVPKKPSAASPNPIKKVTVPPKKLEEQQLPASNEIPTTEATTTNNIDSNGSANVSEADIVAPPEQLVIPVAQAM